MVKDSQEIRVLPAVGVMCSSMTANPPAKPSLRNAMLVHTAIESRDFVFTRYSP